MFGKISVDAGKSAAALSSWPLAFSFFLVSACLVDNYAERRAWSLFEI
jgi:hypothetical protein